MTQFDKFLTFAERFDTYALKKSGVMSIIVGHYSERQALGITDKEVALKTKMAIDKGLNVITCIIQRSYE